MQVARAIVSLGRRLDRLLGLLLSLQLGVEGVSLLDNWLVLVLPVKTSQNKSTAEADGDVGDDFLSQHAGDWGDGRHGY